MTLETIGIVGLGAMGRGLAEVVATCGLRAVLVKASGGATEAAERAIAAGLERSVRKGNLDPAARDEALSRMCFTRELDAVSQCDLVIESVVEDLEVKQQLLAELDGKMGMAAVLGSNTSSLPLGALAESVRGPSRFLGLHFFSPVPAMRLVEIAPTELTYPSAVERAQSFVERIGKTAVMVGCSSGYIVNRLLVPYLLDGIAALESGIARAPDIDTAMRLGCGHPIGPLALADAIGLDVVFAMAKTLHRELNDRRYSPPALLRRLVVSGYLGKKSGQGIYDYSLDPPRENSRLWPAEPGELRA